MNKVSIEASPTTSGPRGNLLRDPALAGISGARLHATVAELCALGRKLPGTPHEIAACGIITRQLHSLGIAHRVLEFDAFIGWPTRSQIAIDGALPQTIAANGVGFTASTGANGVTGKLCVLAPDTPSAELAGSLVLADGLPRYDVITRAARAGAVGVIAISPGHERHYTQASPLWGAPRGPQDMALLSPIPAVQVTRADGEQLRALARQGGVARLIAEGRREWRPVRMPVADIPGHEPHFVLLGAHYCTWMDGAIDNLGAVALLLELARLFATRPKPRYGLRFVWWTGHEQGGYAGSSWYADRFWGELHDHAIAYLNVDINGVAGATTKALRNVTGELAGYAAEVVEGTVGALPPEEDAFVRHALRRQDKYVDPRRSARNSDQSFSGIGLSTAQVSSFLPAASPDHMPDSGLPWWWQTDEDTAERSDGAILATDTLVYRNLLEGLVNAPALPFDYVSCADDILASLREYQEAAPDLEDLAALKTLAERFRGLADRLRSANAANDARRGDTLLLRVARHVNPVLYHAASAFDFDLGRASRLLPGLAPALKLKDLSADDARMARVALRRAANRIAHGLSRAIEAITEHLGEGHLGDWGGSSHAAT
jgi:aminopeptidase YwaD